jgi:hypothetical protein
MCVFLPEKPRVGIWIGVLSDSIILWAGDEQMGYTGPVPRHSEFQLALRQNLHDQG